MATDIERLVVQLSADFKSFEKSLARANGVTNKQFQSIERRARQMNKNLDGIFARSFSGLAAPFTGLGAALGVREIAGYADAWTEAGNKIRAAATSAGVQARSLDSLKDGANEARTALGDYVDLYARLIRSASGVAKSEAEIASATNIVSKAFKAGGASAAEQASGILQLGQALGSGVLQGDELRSLRENAPILAQAIANEFGVTIAGLKDLGAEGKLTSDRVFKAILGAQKPIEAQFAATNATIKDSITQINNEFIAYIGNADSSAGASRGLVDALQGLADNFGTVADGVVQFSTVLISALTGRAIAGAVAGLGNAVIALGAFLTAMRTGTLVAAGFTAALGPIGLLAGAAAAAIYLFADRQSYAEKSADAHQKALKELRFQIENVDYANGEAVTSTRQKIDADIKAAEVALTRAKAERELAASFAKDEISPGMQNYPAPEASQADQDAFVNDNPMVKDRQAVIDQVTKQVEDLKRSQKDFEDYASGKKKPVREGETNTTGFGGGSGALPEDDKSKKSKKERLNEYERETKQITDRTAALVAETEAQRGVNPLIDDFGYAVEKARAQQDLLNAAQSAGVEITPQLRQEISATAEQFALATVEAGRLAESQDKIKQKAEEMADFQKDLTRGIVDGFIEGKDAADIFADALGKIGDKLLDLAFDGLFNTKASGGQGFSFLRLLGLKDGGPVKRLAGGGGVSGPGGPRGDKIPAMLSDGEFVVNAAATKRNRQLLEALNSGGMLKLANGGMANMRAPNMPRLQAPANSNSGPVLNYNPTIDARGASAEAVSRLELALAKDRASFEANTIKAIRKANKTNTKLK